MSELRWAVSELHQMFRDKQLESDARQVIHFIRRAVPEIWRIVEGIYPHVQQTTETVAAADGAISLPDACPTIGSLVRVMYRSAPVHLSSDPREVTRIGYNSQYSGLLEGRSIRLEWSVSDGEEFEVSYRKSPDLPSWTRGLSGDFTLDQGEVENVVGWPADGDLTGGELVVEGGGLVQQYTISSVNQATGKIALTGTIGFSGTGIRFSVYADGNLPGDLWGYVPAAAYAIRAGGMLPGTLVHRIESQAAKMALVRPTARRARKNGLAGVLTAGSPGADGMDYGMRM